MINVKGLNEQSLKRLVKLKESFGRIAIGNELQMIGPLLETMTLIKAAKALPTKVSSFFLTQCFAQIGIDEKECKTGFVGFSFNRLVDQITAGLLNEAIFSPKPTEASSFLLKKSVKSALLFSIGAAEFLESKLQKENKDLSEKTAKEQNFLLESQRILKELILVLVASSDLLKKTYIAVASASGGDKKTAQLIGEILSFLTLLFFSGVFGRVSSVEERNLVKVVSFLAPFFIKSLTLMEALTIEKKDLNENNNFFTLKSLIGEALLSLREENYNHFLELKTRVQEVIGINTKELEKDIQKIEDEIFSLYNSLTNLKEGSATTSRNQTEIVNLA